jgi:Spy/CpxP family protein refolding chaperone
MLTKNVWPGLLLLFIFLPATVMAQGMMHGKWWHNDSIVQGLELTDNEKQELDAAYIESRRKMIELKGEIEMQRFELDLLLGSSEADKEKIMASFETLEQVRDELSKIRFEMLLEIRDIIGADRFQDLEVMHRDRNRKDAKRVMRDRSYRSENDKD